MTTTRTDSLHTPTPRRALRYPADPANPAAVLFPATVVIDTREQLPFSFGGLQADAGCVSSATRKEFGIVSITVPTIRGTLTTGDYSLVGYESEIAIERKSINDLYGTIGGGVRRTRFEAELERLSSFAVAMVVVEGTWADVLFGLRPTRTETQPKTIFRSVIAWRQRYRTVHFDFAGPRRLAEAITFRTLERFWREKQRTQGATA